MPNHPNLVPVQKVTTCHDEYPMLCITCMCKLGSCHLLLFPVSKMCKGLALYAVGSHSPRGYPITWKWSWVLPCQGAVLQTLSPDKTLHLNYKTLSVSLSRHLT